MRSTLDQVALGDLHLIPDWRPSIFVGLGVYLAGLGAWVIVMARSPFSVAYPIGISLSMLVSITAGVIILDELFLPIQALGVFCIFLGIILVGKTRG